MLSRTEKNAKTRSRRAFTDSVSAEEIGGRRDDQASANTICSIKEVVVVAEQVPASWYR